MNTHSIWPLRRARPKIELSTDVSECGTFHLIAVRGRLSIDTAPTLLDELKRTMRHASRIKVGLEDVASIDSSGISVLIQGLKLAQDHSVDYTLLDPSPKVQAVIELSQLHNFFQIETSAGDLCTPEDSPEDSAETE